jgi:peptide chain release factor subunit 1
MTNGTLEDRLRTLADFEPSPWPVLSLYINTQANEHGKDRFGPWLRKEFAAKGRTFEPRSEEAKSFETDAARIQAWMNQELDPASKGAAIFACSGADGFFEAMQVEAPIERNEFYVQDQPHLYTLARLIDAYPRYAFLIADTHSARIRVLELNRVQAKENVENVKTRKTMVGGWSQARFQRHVENFHKQHAKEAMDALDRIVRREDIKHVIIAGDEVVMPLLREELTKPVEEKLVDTLRLDVNSPDHVILQQSLDAFHAYDDRRDLDKVSYMIGEYRAGGLAVIGVLETFSALEKGQVDELILAASPSEIETPEEAFAITPEPAGAAAAPDPEARAALVADALVTKAQQTSAKVSFIENPALLRGVGGCGALLRYKE